MKSILIWILVLALLVGAGWLYRDFYIKREVRKLAFKKYEIIEPLMKKLALQEPVLESEITIVAKDPSLRNGLFHALETYGREDLFPLEYATHEKAAESFLVNWLEFPTELGVAPNEIELLEKITLNESEALDYYVFKYRTNKSHHWMIGVSGPYLEDSILFAPPLRVFSRFNVLNSITTENEARWVHENINPNT